MSLKGTSGGWCEDAHHFHKYNTNFFALTVEATENIRSHFFDNEFLFLKVKHFTTKRVVHIDILAIMWAQSSTLFSSGTWEPVLLSKPLNVLVVSPKF